MGMRKDGSDCSWMNNGCFKGPPVFGDFSDIALKKERKV